MTQTRKLDVLDLADLDDATGGLDWSKVGREAATTAVGFGAIGGVGGATVGGVSGGVPGAIAGGALGAAGGAVWGAAVGAGREVTRQMGWQKKGSGYE